LFSAGADDSKHQCTQSHAATARCRPQAAHYSGEARQVNKSRPSGEAGHERLGGARRKR
jgi:hypothetical protein